MSATRDALDHMQKTGCTAYAAAKKFGITPATLYAAIKRERCPHCGNYVKDHEKPKNVRVLKKEQPELADLLG